MRRCYKLSDFIYRKNFNYICGSDMDPLQSIDEIRQWICEKRDNLHYIHNDDPTIPETVSQPCKVQIRLYAKNVFLVHAAYSQEETDDFIRKLEKRAETDFKIDQLMELLVKSLEGLRIQYELLLEKFI